MVSFFRCLDGRIQLLVAIGQLGPASTLTCDLPRTKVQARRTLGAKVEGLPQASTLGKEDALKKPQL